MLQILCPGAASHIDLWEHKPELERWHGKPLPGEENFVSIQGKNGNLMKSPSTPASCRRLTIACGDAAGSGASR